MHLHEEEPVVFMYNCLYMDRFQIHACAKIMVEALRDCLVVKTLGRKEEKMSATVSSAAPVGPDLCLLLL